MQINAFVPTEYVTLHGQHANALGVPKNVTQLQPMAEGSKIATFAHILLCISALNGTDHDPHFYIKVHDQNGEIRGRLEQVLMWEDSTISPMKWQVLALRMPYVVTGPGVYTFGVYTGPDDGPDEALSSFQIPVTLDLPLTELPLRP